jgi:hypothetical protein
LAIGLSSLLILGGCATDVSRVAVPGMPLDELVARAGKPVHQGDSYLDYTREPWGYYRVTYGPEKRVQALRNLHTEDNFRALQPGMSQADVVATVGVTSWVEGHAKGSAWRYRYRDAGIAKLLWVMFDAGNRLSWYYWEWDPDVYSKGGPFGDRL